MLLNILFIVMGVALVLWGTDRLTDGAVAATEETKIPQTVIGLTIITMGTGMPESCISFISALKGMSNLAINNIVGPNISNALLIVGVSTLVAPMTIMGATVRKDIPFALAASALLLMTCPDGNISRIDTGILFAVFPMFMYMTLRGARKQGADAEEAIEDGKKEPMATWLSVVWIPVGLLCLIGGSNLFVEGTTAVAANPGVSEAVIGLAIMVGGTSLSELAISVISARKGNGSIAIGNVLGSNVFNIPTILGITGMITPMTLKGITYIGLSILVISIMLVWLFSSTGYKVERWEGAVLTTVFVGYIYFLL